MNIQKNASKIYSLALVFLLAGCDSGTETGSLTLAVTDASVDSVQSVVVTFTAVTIKKSGANAETILLDQPRQVDLMSLTGTRSLDLLDQELVSAGHYQWLRLTLDEDPAQTYIIDSLGQHELTIPSGDNNGLKLNRSFTVSPDTNNEFMIDFDLRKSVHMTGEGTYIMRPTLRMVETALSASLSGTLDSSLVTAGCSPGVYLFNEGDAVDDLDGTDDAIFSVALSEQGSYEYSAGFLPAGSYTIAFTCDASDDLSESDEIIDFSHQATLKLDAGEAAVFNIQL